MKVHLIAIGGSIMHNLAIALKKRGYNVSGSDDEIYEPAKSRLKAQGILPAKEVGRVRGRWHRSAGHLLGNVSVMVARDMIRF